MQEDGEPLPLMIDADRSEDEDNSEYLSVIIEIPEDDLGFVGTIDC